jgi:hypothetical protein
MIRLDGRSLGPDATSVELLIELIELNNKSLEWIPVSSLSKC